MYDPDEKKKTEAPASEAEKPETEAPLPDAATDAVSGGLGMLDSPEPTFKPRLYIMPDDIQPHLFEPKIDPHPPRFAPEI